MKTEENAANKATKEEKKKDNIIYFGILAGTPFVICGIDCNLDQMNLGQIRKGTQKYYSVSKENSRPTGKGYAFEDVFARKMRQVGYHVVQVNECKNGPDFIINGRPVQCKYGASPYTVFKNLFEDGKFRYSGQIIITNKENEKALRELCQKNPELFGGDIPEINPPEYVECTTEEATQQYKRGWGSAKNDTKDILRDPRSRNTLCGGMLAVFLATIGIGICIEYRKSKKSEPEKSRLDRLKDSATTSLKKHWGKALAFSIATGTILLGASLKKRQQLRPR